MDAKQKADLYETLGAVYAANEKGQWIQDVWVATPGEQVFSDSKNEYLYAPECGFTGCFAGWRATLDGGITTIKPYGGSFVTLPNDFVLKYNWVDWAAERFGITREAADRLTNADNTLESLSEIIDELVKEFYEDEDEATTA